MLSRLHDINGWLRECLDDLERKFVDETSAAGWTPQAISKLEEEGPLPGRLFAVRQDGVVIYPPQSVRSVPDAHALPMEGKGTARIKGLLDALYTLPGAKSVIYIRDARGELVAGPQEEPVFLVNGKRDSTALHGWYTWMKGGKWAWLLWREDKNGRITWLEINRERFVRALADRLPAAHRGYPRLLNERFELVDSTGRVLYRWGTYDPRVGEAPRVTLDLPRPFHHWRWHCFVDPVELEAAFGRSALFNLLTGLIVSNIALLGLALYLFREYSRKIRDAALRVNFVNQISHELKTPLTNVRMYAELLENSLPEDDEKSARYLDVVISESQRLSRLIGNVLTFGRKQRDALNLNLTLANPDEVISAVLEQFRPSMEQRGIRIEVDYNAPREAKLDVDVLQQILGNLFSNVEKYAASGGFMEVRSQQDGDIITVTVADRGPGIPDGHHETIFQPFYRLSDKLADGVTGTGIGLSIARDLARLHGGDLVLVPAEKGACFRLTLRAARVKRQD